MKTLRKHAIIAFLLVAMTTIIPIHANSNINYQTKAEELLIELKKTEAPWYKTSEGLKDCASTIGIVATWVSFPFVFHSYVDAKMGLEGKPKNQTSLLDEIKKWSKEATATERVGIGFISLSFIGLLFSLPVMTGNSRSKKSEIPWYKKPEVHKDCKDFAVIAGAVAGWASSPYIFYACKDQIKKWLKI